MKKIVATALLVTSLLDGDCKVQAWVRADDLVPDHVSPVNLPPYCANRVASVARVRLQLDEFGDVTYLRRGAVLTEIPGHRSNNQPVLLDVLGFLGGSSDDAVYDYRAYDRATSDSAFWVVKGEERRAWYPEVVRFQHSSNSSKPMVAPFSVASPAVNYPPALMKNTASVLNP
ncbi:hypothetical protein B0H17DRAFT_1082098 [Mycena rosella]|uniref:Uncharacterized protein n=1 Tax=Mycena rosella TaxID=1033263 RepID=A0AAD7D5G6_MYCRO|nr:hypothetical protein B0H17DRAFT_1082098 [Mycena rosella]